VAPCFNPIDLGFVVFVRDILFCEMAEILCGSSEINQQNILNGENWIGS
jgi:hypothetical protein